MLRIVVDFTIFISLDVDTYTKSHGKVSAISDNTAIEFEWSPSTTNHFANLTIINLLYVGHFTQEIENKSNVECTQNTATGSFSGKGILGRNIDVNVNGTSKVIPIENLSVYISRREEFISTNGDIAPYTFQVISHYKKD